MKTHRHFFRLWQALAAALLLSPLAAQEAEPPPQPAAPQQIDALVRKLAGCNRQGDRQGARAIGIQLREIASQSPENARLVFENLRALCQRGEQAAPPDQAATVAKIDHLRQAADHLAAAGYREHATMARQEAARLAAEIQKQRAAAPKQPRRGPAPPDAASAAGIQDPAAAAAMLQQLGEINRRLNQLSRRLQRLELEDAPDQP